MKTRNYVIIGIIAIASVFVIGPIISYDMWRNIMEEDKVELIEPDEYELKLNHFRTLDCNLFEANRVYSDLIENNAYQQRQQEC